ncbi:tetratricopeptide repeat protein [Deinococcus roseus]|uniref:Bacterial transcriptional activator domain-containing protein n=1 Tax=Deinococcus roseus TaxID=392414 RepID=A0ABQ2DDX6_9DEIO|nr:tetratricopeptide repeat protein [Deinococcus roseus]GGJ54901.1 hypothetical protein GCM10008938_46200 [Deinococcus roseus]
MKRIHRPPQALKQELPRALLLERLARAQDHKLVVLLAPSGYGKTTLLAQFARTSPQKVLWLSLQEDDADPAMLRHSMALALSSLELGLDPSSPLRLLAQALNTIPDNLRLILDGVQHLGGEAGRELDSFIDALSEGHQVLLSTYMDPPIRLARHLAQGTALLLGPDQLSFTPQETELYLQARHYAGNALHAHQTLQGWAAGLALISSEASLHYAPEDLILESLDTLPSALRKHLPQAAVLDVWSEEMAAATGIPLPEGWLDEVRKLGLPLTPLGAGRHLPHHLMTQTLERELKKNPELYRTLHTRAARKHQEQEENLRALQHFLKAGEHREAVQLAERLIEGYSQRAELLLIRQVLQDFPLEVLSDTLKAQLAIAWIETGNGKAGAELLRSVEHLQTPQVLYHLGRLYSRQGRREDHVQQLKHAEHSLHAYPRDIRLHWLKSHALMNLGEVQEALQSAQQAHTLALFQQAPVEVGLSLYIIANCQEQLALLSEAQQTLRQALLHFETLKMPARTITILNDLAHLHLRKQEYEEARKLLERALPIARVERNSFLAVLLETLGEIHLALQDLSGGMDHLQEALQHSQDTGQTSLEVRIRLTLAESLCIAGRPREAAQHLAFCTPPPEKFSDMHRFVEGLLAFQQGESREAQRLFETLIGQDTVHALRAESHLAELERQQGQLDSAALNALKRHLQNHPEQHQLRRDHHLGLLLHNKTLAFESSALQKPVLKIFTLGRLKVLTAAGDLHLPFAKAGELLVWLALHGRAHRDRIVDALWEGSREEKHVGYFKVAVRKLRAVLMEHHPSVLNPLPFENGQYSLSPELDVQLDALHLEHDPDFDLAGYQGDFLPAFDTEWILQHRDHLRECMVRLCLTRARNETHLTRALQAYQKALQLDPLSLPIHQEIIRLYHREGDVQLSQRAYQQYARLMREELGDHPEPYEVLLSS